MFYRHMYCYLCRLLCARFQDLPTDDDDDNGHVVDLPEDAHYSYVKDMLARLPSYSEVG